MHTIATISLLLTPPGESHFRSVPYGAFRARLDSAAAQRPVRLYSMPGSVLVCDEQHRVIGKILSPSVDDWGIASDSEYQLPEQDLSLTLPQRLALRAAGASAPVYRRMHGPVRRLTGLRKRKRGAAAGQLHGAVRQSGDCPDSIKWTTLRLAG